MWNLPAQYVDAIILNAPCDMPSSAYNSFGINVVVNGDENAGLKVLPLNYHVPNISDLLPRKIVQVMVPQLQTLKRLRENVLGGRELYETRQRRRELQIGW
jgi:hypothetical protein